MEQIKNRLKDLGRRLGKAAASVIRTAAKAAADLLGRVAGYVAKFARDKGGQMVRSAGNKVKSTAKEHRQGLLLIAACVSGAAMAASLIGWFLGRKK